jgi:uncharacterized protein (DUF1499 family)
MALLPWLISAIFPACGAVGVGGLPMPPPMDMAAIVRPASPNTALAGPAGFSPMPDIVTPSFAVPPDRLYAAILAVSAVQPRTYPAAEYAYIHQAHFVARTAVLNFPDLVTVSVSGPAEGPSTLVVWSRSVYGRSDLGANRKRVETWLGALQTIIER